MIDPVTLEDLKASIAQIGILTPLLFRVGEESWLIIISGERRYQAAMALGMTTVPGICVEGNFAEIALVENLQRQDLTAVEEAEALNRLMDQESYTQEQLGGIVGKARTTVRDILTLNRLPQTIRDECRGDRTISRQTLIDIARKKQERGMVTAWNAYRDKQDKAQTNRTKRDPNDPAVVLEFAQRAAAKIPTIDASSWTEDERESLRVAFVDIQNQIDAYLNPNPGLA